MKKGFFVALLMAAVVAMAIPSFGKAPLIKDLPDIVIGDTGDITAGDPTTAKHLFRYLNALNLYESNRIVWYNDGFPAAAKHVFIYRDTATDPINVQASQPTQWVDTLSDGQYTSLVAGIDPGGNTNVMNAASTFGFLSLMNRDLATGSMTDAYTADPAVNGLTTDTYPAGALGVTDLVMLAYELDPPSLLATSPTLLASKEFTVYTLAGDDLTSGDIIPVDGWDYAGGSAQSWVGQSDPGVAAGYPANPVITESTLTDGAIGFDGSAAPAGAWGVWKSSTDGTNPQYVIDGAGREGLVMRVRANMVTEAGATRDSCLSYRFNVQNLYGNHWSGVYVQSIATGGTDVAPIDCPAGGDPLEMQIHWAVPYDVLEYDDTGLLAATDWQTSIPHPSIPADGRNYVIQWDGIDLGDANDLFMDSCIVEAYPRPADADTPDIEWGGASGIGFNHAENGFISETSVPFAGFTIASASITTDSATATMGSVSSPKWQQISQNTLTATQTVPEVANDLMRLKITYNSGTDPDAAPNVRFQTTPIRNSPTSMADVDLTIWYDNLVPYNLLNSLSLVHGINFSSAAEDAPGAPRTAAAGGSTIDVYRYTMNTSTGTRFMRYYWDVYGIQIPGGWPASSGSLSVTNIVVNAGLSNP